MNKTEVTATLLAYTDVTTSGVHRIEEGYEQAIYDGRKDLAEVYKPEAIAEYAGRTCYRAYGIKNEKTADTSGYLGNIIDQNHLSVVEHLTATILFEGISRSASHEIVRHRHFSFSQESQRYVDALDMEDVVIPPLLRGNEEEERRLMLTAKLARHEAIHLADNLRSKGLPRKEANEAARAHLPQCMATTLVVSGNMRSWMEFISKRLHPAADKEIQEIAQAALELLEEAFPAVFHDNKDKWLGNTGGEQHGARH